MKTIVEALQDLYVALGGEASAVSNLTLNPDVIEQIATLIESGGGGGGGGGDNVFVIGASYDEETHATTMNKTVQEIINAANAGKMLWFYMPSEGSNMPVAGPVVRIDFDTLEEIYTISVACNTASNDSLFTVVAAQFDAASLTDYPISDDI